MAAMAVIIVTIVRGMALVAGEIDVMMGHGVA
jgi:uncharacterized membrane protein YjjP (DUF1212 family)